MRAYVDCPGCSCLVGVGDASCPFCGHGLRSSSAAPLWLALGLVFSLGTVSVSCVDKEGASASESQGSDSYESLGVTYAGPDETSVTDPGGDSSSTDPDMTTVDPTPDASTYAGPDETWSTSDSTTASSGSSSEGSSGEGTGSTGEGTGSSGESSGEGTGESSGGTGSTG